MSLDMVEMVMEVEQAFQVRFENAEAEQITTMGRLHDAVLRKLAHRRTLACMSSRAFYRTRHSLREVFGVPRRAVRVDAALELLLPDRRHRDNWRRLQASLFPLRLPELERPGWVSKPLTWISLSLFAMAGCLLAYSAWAKHLHPAALPMLAGATIFAWGSYIVTLPLAVCFPTECSTVRGLVECLLRSGYLSFAGVDERGADDEIWRILRSIVGCQFGVDPEKLTRETHFIYDLGVE